jgi:hypothetical protein
MTTVRARPDSNASRLRVFREEELSIDDDFGEEPTSPSRRLRVEVDPLDQTDAAAVPTVTASGTGSGPRIRPARVTQPLPLPRPPRR